MPLHIPFETIDWNEIKVTEHKGESGTAWWRTIQLGSVRIRMVEYSPGYSADHWCQKGHIIYCIEGKMITELEDGRSFVLKQGMSYHVSDNASSHKSITATGAKLFIIDGDFLQ
jgi:quercetin dioxygenase-like cupin family protein